MACLEMYNPDHKGAPMSPRISFSNDFVENHQHSSSGSGSGSINSKQPISTDFEFSVSSNSLQLSADELFFKGRILPLKDTNFPRPATTLRDELLASDDGDEDHGFSPKPPLKGRWRGFLGLRKSPLGSKKQDSAAHRACSEPNNGFFFPLKDPSLSKTKEGMLTEDAASSSADMEMKP